MKRVVITGMGIVSPVGTGIEHAWKNIIAGKSGVVKLEGEEFADLTTQIAGVPVSGTGPGEYNPDPVVDAKEQKRVDRFIVYVTVAADEAVRDAGLADPIAAHADPERIGVCIGGGIGGLSTIYDTCVELYKEGPRRVSPFFIPKVIINMASGNVSIKYGFKGPNLSVVTACATGTHAIGESVRIIQHGDADIMVAGGTEAAATRISMAGFCAMRAMSTRNDDPHAASRPWDKGRDGFVLGEGAGVLVLEEYEHAKARGAKIYAEVIGYGMSGDAYHITAPAPGGEGALRAMRAALRDAGIEPAAVDYINAHGTSTGLGDVGEFEAVKALFGDLPVSMSSTKSMTGHLLGAAGAVEAIFCVMALRDQIVPPTINLDDPEEITAGFDLVPNVAKKRPVNITLSNSFGFGGTNATVILKKI
ncbi:MAG: beta-ketoacyl-ACP synthase II [Proteobacteria bacterium]|nr:beta-ketoacyl-ACP synthase II [Pseudomonadota bacterium]